MRSFRVTVQLGAFVAIVVALTTPALAYWQFFERPPGVEVKPSPRYGTQKQCEEALKKVEAQFGKNIMIIFAGTNGYLDDLEVEQVRAFSEELNKYVESMNPKLLDTIMQKKTIDDGLKAEIEKMLKEFKGRFVAERQSVAKA